MLCKSEGAQASNTRANSHLGGSGGMLPWKNFQLSDSVSEASDSSFDASFYCVRHTDRYTHLKNEGAHTPLSMWRWEGRAQAPSAPLFLCLCTSTPDWIITLDKSN